MSTETGMTIIRLSGIQISITRSYKIFKLSMKVLFPQMKTKQIRSLYGLRGSGALARFFVNQGITERSDIGTYDPNRCPEQYITVYIARPIYINLLSKVY